MRDTLLKGLILVLAFLGIADAWYLTQSALTGAPLTCDIGGLDGCNIVAQSQYSHLFGAPLALYGVFFYALAFVVAALALYVPLRRIIVGLFALGIVGLIASIIFEAIQIFLIKALCVYCLGSAAISFFIFLAAFALFRKGRTDIVPRPPVVTPWEPPAVLS